MDKRELINLAIESIEGPEGTSLDTDVIVRNMNDDREVDGERMSDYTSLHISNEDGKFVIGIYGPPMTNEEDEDYNAD